MVDNGSKCILLSESNCIHGEQTITVGEATAGTGVGRRGADHGHNDTRSGPLLQQCPDEYQTVSLSSQVVHTFFGGRWHYGFATDRPQTGSATRTISIMTTK